MTGHSFSIIYGTENYLMFFKFQNIMKYGSASFPESGNLFLFLKFLICIKKKIVNGGCVYFTNFLNILVPVKG